MKLLFVAALALVAALAHAHPLSQPEIDARFEAFKYKFGRLYSNYEEEQFRKNIFAEKLAFIESHNADFAAGRTTYAVGVNKFSDWTREEMRTRSMGYRRPAVPKAKPGPHFVDVSGLPATVDWRTKGVVTPVKNQQQCGSCWAFATTGAIEGQHALITGNLVSLSEQNLVDCSYTQGDEGCGGGDTEYAFQYVITNKGIDTEASYPYEAVNEPSCSFNRSTVGATISTYVELPVGSEESLQLAVARIGPISVCIDAEDSFQAYNGTGVYYGTDCDNTPDSLDHCVLAVGYGTTSDGHEYWLVKNSWGTDWGAAGYIYMSRNRGNNCGIAADANYPVV